MDVQTSSSEDFQRQERFYENAKQYWATVTPTIDGMLGGFGEINDSDIYSSEQFLKEIYKMKPTPHRQRALDCGAGIGRVSKHLLMPLYDTVDLVEQQAEFTDKITEYINEPALVRRLGDVYTVGLQGFTPDTGKYDLIWCQWVLGHLRDDDFVEFFKRCGKGLTPSGLIIIKENVTSNEDNCVDAKDSSVTRSLRSTKQLLGAANLRIVKMVREKYFIQGLFPVYFIVCKPIKS